MVKEWKTPEVEVIDVKNTENGSHPSEKFDGPWEQIGDKWFRPGDGTPITSV